MKISEFTSKDFLNNAGAFANSYVLVNYKDNSTNKQVTYKTNLDTLSKAIAANLKLVTLDNFDELTQIEAENGAYSVDASINYKPYPLKKALFINTSNDILYYGDGSSYGSNITKCNKPFVAYDSTTNALYYYDFNSSEYIPYQQTELDERPLVRYDQSQEHLEYFNTIEQDYVTIETGGSGDAPVAADVSDIGEMPYVFYNSSNAAFYIVESDQATDMGKPLFVNASGVLQFGGNENGSFLFGASEITFKPLAINSSNGTLVSFTNTGMEDVMGKVVFYDSTTGKLNYFDGSEAVEIT